MSLADVVRGSFQRSIGLYDELVNALPEEALSKKLPGLPSNSIGAQLWCVVGARESYCRGMKAGEWIGFSCSLGPDDILRQQALRQSFEGSARQIAAALDGLESFTDTQHQLMADLLEHECAHQGQLIRYLYGLRLPIPAGWKKRYALD